MANELSKLKPFNLEAALKGEKVVTRDGREVLELKEFKTPIYSNNQLVGVISRNLFTFTLEGVEAFGAVSPRDLFMAPKERVVWVNFYGEAAFSGNAAWHDSQESADKGAGTNSKRLGGKAFPITITEGKN